MTVPVLPSFDPSHIFPFPILLSQVHPTGFSSDSSLSSLTFLSYRRQTWAPHLQDGSRLTFSWPSSYIFLPSFTFPRCRIFVCLLFVSLAHFYLVVIKHECSDWIHQVLIGSSGGHWFLPSWFHQSKFYYFLEQRKVPKLTNKYRKL